MKPMAHSFERLFRNIRRSALHVLASACAHLLKYSLQQNKCTSEQIQFDYQDLNLLQYCKGLTNLNSPADLQLVQKISFSSNKDHTILKTRKNKQEVSQLHACFHSDSLKQVQKRSSRQINFPMKSQINQTKKALNPQGCSYITYSFILCRCFNN